MTAGDGNDIGGQVSQPCVTESAAHVLHGAHLDAAADQLSAWLLDPS